MVLTLNKIFKIKIRQRRYYSVIGLISTMSFTFLAEEVQSPISDNITIINDYIWREELAQHIDSANNHEKEVTISDGLDYDINNTIQYNTIQYNTIQ